MLPVSSAVITTLLISYFGSAKSFLTPFSNRVTFAADRIHELHAKLLPSRVDDDYEHEGEQPPGPISGVDLEDADLPTIDESEILPLMQYNASLYPIPGQPWRRGDTSGAEDPIDAPWRLEAEKIIYNTVENLGGKCKGVTWLINKCVVTLIPESLSNVRIDPGPEVIWVDNADGYKARTDFDWQDKSNVDEDEWLMKEDEDEAKSDAIWHGLNLSQRQQADQDENDESFPWFDGNAISTIGKYIDNALSEPEIDSRLDIISRFEIVFAFPGDNPIELEVQTDYDVNTGKEVLVTTIDPFKSNRTLQGNLVCRNALDVKIDVNGRVVTIPLNFVHQVLLVV